MPGGCLPRWLTGVSSRGPGIVEYVRRLKPDEAAVRAGERERFGASVDGVASGHMLQRYELVPSVPILVAAERAGHARVAALQEIKDVLRRNPLSAAT